MRVTNLADRFSLIAAKYAEHPALRFASGETVSYNQLSQKVEDAVAFLEASGLTLGRCVAILHGKTLDAYVVQLAAIMIGAPYCCLDEKSPSSRHEVILERLQPDLVIAAGVAEECIQRVRVATKICKRQIPIWDLGTEVAPKMVATPNLRQPVIGSDIAYLMFTSGSTGQPKGVAVSHDNVLNFIDWTRDTFSITSDDVLSNVNHMHFDNSVFDFYASLFNGACMAPVLRQEVETFAQTTSILEVAGCTILYAVPTFLLILQGMDELDADRLPNLKAIVFAGEGFPKLELYRLYTSFSPRARIVNAYGPTECTCLCSALDLEPQHFQDMTSLAPLGPMAPNVRGLVLEGNTEVADGETGELCLIGPTVALGYFRDPERTQVAFCNNPVRREIPERMYRTGDIVRKDKANGYFHFVGRVDQQVQHLGYRIELGEIEAGLNALDSISQAVVLYVPGQTLGQIIAFVSTKSTTVDEAFLLKALHQTLPGYMVPSKIEIREQLPRNSNGKVDRIQLAKEVY